MRSPSTSSLAAFAAARPLPLALLAALAIALLTWAVVHAGRPWSLVSGDAFEYAEIGRRIATGRGFSTGSLYPAELSFGVTQEHPSLLRTPLWPLFLAGFFGVFGAAEASVQGAIFLLFVLNVLAATALAARIAGPVPAVATALAVATSPYVLTFTLDGNVELLSGLTLTLIFLACAAHTRPFVVGGLCALAYLARSNAIAVLPPVLLLLGLRQRALRPALTCAGGFLLVASPWWIRNLIVAGNPFFSLYAWVPRYLLDVRQPHRTLLNVPDPSADVPFAVNPIDKVLRLLPALLLRWPLASANLAACLGVALACLRRDGLGLAFVFLAAANTLAVALAANLGRYFAPLVPTLVALGAAAWWQHGGRLRHAGLAVLVAAALLPAFPAELADIRMLRAALWMRPAAPVEGMAASPLRRCLAPGAVIMTAEPGRLAWTLDVIGIHPAATRRDFWEIVARHPVRFVETWRRFPVPRRELEKVFAPRPDCAPDLYERRPGHTPGPPPS